MDTLLQHITRVQEQELGVKEFQVVVLSALLNIMKEQESLNKTLQHLTSETSKNTLDTMELYSEESSDDEEHTKGESNIHIYDIIGHLSRQTISIKYTLLRILRIDNLTESILSPNHFIIIHHDTPV